MYRHYFAVFTQRNYLFLLLLGFSSGLPLALTSGTLQAWMTVEGIDLKTIGFFSLAAQAYVFKFLWSPFMDRYTPSLGSRRRGWLLISQLLLIAGIVVTGFLEPSRHLWWLAAMAVFIAFCSASQDIAFDAWRTDLLDSEQRGTGAAISVLGYRLAMLVSGGLALWLADRWLGWQYTYWLMAMLMLIGVFATVLAPEPDTKSSIPKNMEQAVIAPLKDFFSRNNAWLIMLLIVLYKLGDAFAGSLSTAFLIRSVGFDAGSIGLVNKTFGLFATVTGALSGGLLMQRLNLFRSLMIFGVLQAISNAGYWMLSVTDKSIFTMTGAVFLENFCGGMGTAAFVALIMTLCNKSFSATQFALLSALSAVGRVYVGPVAGWFVETYSWPLFYLFSIAVAFPGLIILFACRQTLEFTQQTDKFIPRTHFKNYYRLALRLLTIGAGLLIMWLLLVIVNASISLSVKSIADTLFFWGIGIGAAGVILGGSLDYLSLKRTKLT